MRSAPPLELAFGRRGALLDGTRAREAESVAAGADSVYLTVTDDTGRVVGVARLIRGPAWQLASLAVRSSRESTVATALCHGIVQALRVNGVRDLVVTLDPPARELLARVGLLPTTSSVAHLLDRQRRLNPEGYRLVTEGRGLEDVALPHPTEFIVAAPVRVGPRELAATA